MTARQRSWFVFIRRFTHAFRQLLLSVGFFTGPTRAVIQVLNGTGTQNFAGPAGQILNQAGYAGTLPRTPTAGPRRPPPSSRDPRMEEPRDIAISSVFQRSPESGLRTPTLLWSCDEPLILTEPPGPCGVRAFVPTTGVPSRGPRPA